MYYIDWMILRAAGIIFTKAGLLVSLCAALLEHMFKDMFKDMTEYNHKNSIWQNIFLTRTDAVLVEEILIS